MHIDRDYSRSSFYVSLALSHNRIQALMFASNLPDHLVLIQ